MSRKFRVSVFEFRVPLPPLGRMIAGQAWLVGAPEGQGNGGIFDIESDLSDVIDHLTEFLVTLFKKTLPI